MLRTALFILFISLGIACFSQEESKTDYPKNTLTIGVGRARDIRDELSFTGIGLDYLRRFNYNWEYGVQMDFEWNPGFDGLKGTAMAAILAYAITPKWPVFAGPGLIAEGSQYEGFGRIGSEYVFFIDKKQFLFFAPGIFADFKPHHGTSLSVMFVLGANW